MPTASQKFGDIDVTPFGAGRTELPVRPDVERASERTDGLRVSMAVYNTDLFDAATIERMLRHFEMLLDGAVANPDEPVSKLPPAQQRRARPHSGWSSTIRRPFIPTSASMTL